MKDTSVHTIMLVSWFSFGSFSRGHTKDKNIGNYIGLLGCVPFHFSTDSS